MNENVKPTNTQTEADDRPVRYYIPAIEKMRLILMGLAILYTFGSYSPIAEINSAVLGFVFPALFIISGYLVIWEGPATDKRILKAIGKTAICFVVLTGVFILLSLWADKAKTMELLTSRWFWMDFLVRNAGRAARQETKAKGGCSAVRRWCKGCGACWCAQGH